jgi:hypothetical protein
MRGCEQGEAAGHGKVDADVIAWCRMVSHTSVRSRRTMSTGGGLATTSAHRNLACPLT